MIAPVREWDLKCRPDEVAYAHAHNVPVPEGANDNPYSIDDNLWGRAIECGHLEDPWNEPLDDAWVMTKNPEDTPDTPTYTEIEFEAGKPVAVDGKKMKLSEIVIALTRSLVTTALAVSTWSRIVWWASRAASAMRFPAP